MTRPDIAGLRRLLAEATPGPWRVTQDGSIYAEAGCPIVAPCLVGIAPDLDATSNLYGFDAAIIVAAVNALPGLLDELERLERDNDRCRRLEAAKRTERDAAWEESAAATAKVAELEREVERLRRLEPYAQHKVFCTVSTSSKFICSCGFFAVGGDHGT